MKTNTPTARARKSGLAFAIATASLLSLSAHATFELDQQYSLGTVAVLKSWDNVDGLFEGYVENAYREYFSKETRFTLMDAAPAVKVLTDSKIPYKKIIEDKTILKQLGRTVRAETLIRTRVYKEGPQYRFKLDWLHSVRLDILAQHEFTVPEPRQGEALSAEMLGEQLKRGLDDMILKVPFMANVTGRDNDWVTLNVGYHSSIRPGDVLVISTLEEVKRHPLLETVVEWRFAEAGRVQISSIDGGMAFGQVIQEEPKRKIGRLQKVTKVLPPSDQPGAKQVVEAEKLKKKQQDEAVINPWYARLGYGFAGAWVGLFQRDYNNGTTNFPASSLLFGAQARGEVWFTQSVFANLDVGFGTGSLGSITKFAPAVGFKYYVDGTVMGPAAWARIGFKTLNYSLTLDTTTNFVSPNTFAGLFIGGGGELPLRDGWTIQLTFDLGLFTTHTETGLGAGAARSVLDASAFFGVSKLLWPPRMGLKAGIDIQANNASYATGASVTQRSIAGLAAVMYYF